IGGNPPDEEPSCSQRTCSRMQLRLHAFCPCGRLCCRVAGRHGRRGIVSSLPPRPPPIPQRSASSAARDPATPSESGPVVLRSICLTQYLAFHRYDALSSDNSRSSVILSGTAKI